MLKIPNIVAVWEFEVMSEFLMIVVISKLHNESFLLSASLSVSSEDFIEGGCHFCC